MTTVTGADGEDDLPEQVRIRHATRTRLISEGHDPYAFGYPVTTSLSQVREQYGELAADTFTGDVVGVVGRLMLNRVSGKIVFATVREGLSEVQVMLTADASGTDLIQRWEDDVDLGDLVGVTGEVITSKRGELSVLARDFQITSKCLRPLPEKHKGLADPEQRVRNRYVDLIIRPEAQQIVRMRSAVVAQLRSALHERGFLEVETPMLQVIPGGANARPFVTHINAYDIPLYLRIAPELYLKRLLVGGFERIFEINRNFRNEGVDASHNPEFTMVEIYEAYGDYHTMRVLTQQLYQEAAVAAFGEQVARRVNADGSVDEYDLSGDWPVRTMFGALSEALGEPVDLDTPVEKLQALAQRFGLEEPPYAGPGQLLEALYVELVESRTTTPVFYTDFPKETAPLTRLHRDDPRLTEKWDLVGWGTEMGTGYSELIDPVDQRERFMDQLRRADRGDEEAMRLDEDFLRALEYGMPPAGGQGMGIDRLLRALTGLSVRDTIAFPLVKPERLG